mmetsp:Transcript_89055/g.278973  ORF Transcript_89055/g.278973 Transcript_89055/m.278973 type:complete len:258 (-) Transcript_89055:233-1006(-)
MLLLHALLPGPRPQPALHLRDPALLGLPEAGLEGAREEWPLLLHVPDGVPRLVYDLCPHPRLFLPGALCVVPHPDLHVGVAIPEAVRVRSPEHAGAVDANFQQAGVHLLLRVRAALEALALRVVLEVLLELFVVALVDVAPLEEVVRKNPVGRHHLLCDRLQRAEIVPDGLLVLRELPAVREVCQEAPDVLVKGGLFDHGELPRNGDVQLAGDLLAWIGLVVTDVLVPRPGGAVFGVIAEVSLPKRQDDVLHAWAKG